MPARKNTRGKRNTVAQNKAKAKEQIAAATAAKKLVAKGTATLAKAEKAKHTATLRKLAPVAKEIGVRWAKAQKADDQAADHRLAAAIRAGEAKQLCEDSGIKFKDWSEENLKFQNADGETKKLAYETVRKLASAGSSEDPRAELDKLRTRAREGMKRTREQKKLTNKSTPAAPRVSKLKAAEEALEALGDQGTLNLLQSRAPKLGMAVISQADAKRVAESGSTKQTNLMMAKSSAELLTSVDKSKLLRWLAKDLGAKLTFPKVDTTVQRGVPAFLDRRPKKGKSANGANAA